MKDDTWNQEAFTKTSISYSMKDFDYITMH